MIWDRITEQSALGAAMLDGRRAWDVLDVAKPRDFHDTGHEQVAEAIRRVATRGGVPDPVVVGDELLAMGATIHQGHAYLHELTSIVPTAANAGYYAERVSELAQRRRLGDAADAVRVIAGDASLPPAEGIERARAELDGIIDGTSSDTHLVGATVDAVIASLAEAPEMVPTPWRDVNALIGGLRPGCVYIVGARPATGKTAMGLNLAVGMAKSGSVAAFVSLEMSEAELQKRLIAQLGKVNLKSLVNNALDEDDWPRVAAAREQIMQLPLAVLDNAAATVAQIRGYVRSLSRTQKLGSLTVDYVGLLQGDPSKERRILIGEFSRAMKLIAKEFHIPVIVLSQLNRESEKRMDKRPSIAELKESGDLEQDADVVLLLWRDEEKQGEVGVIVAKNRHGTAGEVSLAWMGHYQLMGDLARDWEPGA